MSFVIGIERDTKLFVKYNSVFEILDGYGINVALKLQGIGLRIALELAVFQHIPHFWQCIIFWRDWAIEAQCQRRIDSVSGYFVILNIFIYVLQVAVPQGKWNGQQNATWIVWTYKKIWWSNREHLCLPGWYKVLKGMEESTKIDNYISNAELFLRRD